MIINQENLNNFIRESNEYASRVENEIIQNIAESFPYFILKLFYQLSDSEICGALRGLGSYDYGLDAFFIKEEENTIFFIQFKSSCALESMHYAEREWFLALNDITDSIIKHRNLENIQSQRIIEIASMDYSDFKNSIGEFDVKKVIFHMGDCNQNIINSFEDVEYINLEDILETYQKNLDEASDESINQITINLQPQYPDMFGSEQPYIQFTQNSFNGHRKKSCIFPLSGLSIVDLIADKSTRLLERNVRGYLGPNNEVNKGIINTAMEKPDSFYFFNNGISISCEQLSIDNNKLLLIDPQIINGAQTVHSLIQAFNNLKKKYPIEDVRKHMSKIHILCRAMETDKNFSNSGTKDKLTYSTSLTTFNNKQNKMKVTDFFSGNKEQVAIQNALKDLNVGYRIKRGLQYEKAMAHYPYMIDMETLGEMYLQGYQVFPPSAGKIFSKNFDDNKDYQFVFDKYHNKRFEYYFITILHYHLSKRFKKIKEYLILRNENYLFSDSETEAYKNELTNYIYHRLEYIQRKLTAHCYNLDYKLFFYIMFRLLHSKIKDQNYNEIDMQRYVTKFRNNTSNINYMTHNIDYIIPIALDIYATILLTLLKDNIGKSLPKTKRNADKIDDILASKMSDSWSYIDHANFK